MEIITKIITGLGGVGTVTGLFWIWSGSVDLFKEERTKISKDKMMGLIL